MIDFENKSVFKLKENFDYGSKVADLLIKDERIVGAYKSMRDGVVFTDRRLIAVNVQGLTGSKVDYTTLPYSNVVAFSVETSGTFDIDSELELYFSALGRVRFEFTGKTNVVEIAKLISAACL